MNWNELLLKDEWKKRRDEILVRDNFTCQIPGCLRKEGVEVHHRIYLGTTPWDYPDDLLITLCGFHHQQYHDHIHDLEEKLCNTLKMKGFMLSELLALDTKLHEDEFAQSLLKTLRNMQNG